MGIFKWSASQKRFAGMQKGASPDLSFLISSPDTVKKCQTFQEPIY